MRPGTSRDMCGPVMPRRDLSVVGWECTPGVTSVLRIADVAGAHTTLHPPVEGGRIPWDPA